jgi:hypothetical protein
MIEVVTASTKRSLLAKAIADGGQCRVVRKMRSAYALSDAGLGSVSYDDAGFMDFTINDSGRSFVSARGC